MDSKSILLQTSFSARRTCSNTEYCSHLYGVATANVYPAAESLTWHDTNSKTSRIACGTVKQGARFAMITQVAIENSATESKQIKKLNMHSRLMKGKEDILVATFNVQTLQKEGKIPELIASAVTTKTTVKSAHETADSYMKILFWKNTFSGNWRIITISTFQKIV